jgi:hypothetical protein
VIDVGDDGHVSNIFSFLAHIVYTDQTAANLASKLKPEMLTPDNESL